MRPTILILLVVAAILAWPVSVHAGDDAGTSRDTSPRVTIDPVEVAEGEEYPHAMAVWISPPWEQEGRWNLRAPETLGSNFGVLFIDHWRPDMVPAFYPMNDLGWEPREDGGLAFECHLDRNITMVTEILPHEDSLTVRYHVVNAWEHTLMDLGLQFCLIQRGVKGFEDPLGERTFIVSDGRFIPIGRTPPGVPSDVLPMFILTNTKDRPTPRPFDAGESWVPEGIQADYPFIATVSEDGGHAVAVAFENAYKIMSNCRIPCIHADPDLEDAAPGDVVKTHGRVYFTTRTESSGPLEAAVQRFLADFPEWAP